MSEVPMSLSNEPWVWLPGWTPNTDDVSMIRGSIMDTTEAGHEVTLTVEDIYYLGWDPWWVWMCSTWDRVQVDDEVWAKKIADWRSGRPRRLHAARRPRDR